MIFLCYQLLNYLIRAFHILIFVNNYSYIVHFHYITNANYEMEQFIEFFLINFSSNLKNVFIYYVCSKTSL